MKPIVFILLCAMCFTLPIQAQQKDNPACKDHPLFTRMPDYWIHGCVEKEFDAYVFKFGPGRTETVEGHYWSIRYYPQATATVKPSELQILRNFENAVLKLGGKILHSEKSRRIFQLTRDGKEFWVEATAEFTGKYALHIVEKGEMAQDITANAGVFADDLKNMGHTAVYGIFFDTGKSELKPESEQAMAEIAKLLKNDPGLKVFVVGHTDNTGSLDQNMTLSRDRAEAVLQALVRTHGISAARLKAFGNGPYAPVASNDTDSGKAKNRRVELVKQ